MLKAESESISPNKGGVYHPPKLNRSQRPDFDRTEYLRKINDADYLDNAAERIGEELTHYLLR